IVKDIAAGMIRSEPRSQIAADPDAIVDDIDAATLAANVRTGIAHGDLYIDNDWTPDFKQHRSLLLARMRLLPATAEPLPVEPLGEAAREALMDRFLASSDAPPDNDTTGGILVQCLSARCD